MYFFVLLVFQPVLRGCVTGGGDQEAQYPRRQQNGRSDGIRKHSLGRPEKLGTTEIVVSYCKASLSWLANAVDDLTCLGANVSRVHIVSKCGHSPDAVNLPSMTKIIVAPRNVGRCDHTFAEFIVKRYDSLPSSIFFLKDTSASASPGQRSLSIRLLGTELLSSQDGFACGSRPPTIYLSPDHAQALWHVAQRADDFELDTYHPRHEQSGPQALTSKASKAPSLPFIAPNRPLRNFINATLSRNAVRHLDAKHHPLRLVCYGGIFATIATSVRRQSRKDWRALRDALGRGDNIEEGHYVERLWAALLTEPVSAGDVFSLLGLGIDRKPAIKKKKGKLQLGTGVPIRTESLSYLPGLLWQGWTVSESIALNASKILIGFLLLVVGAGIHYCTTLYRMRVFT